MVTHTKHICVRKFVLLVTQHSIAFRRFIINKLDQRNDTVQPFKLLFERCSSQLKHEKMSKRCRNINVRV
jgi:hypothetical protein